MIRIIDRTMTLIKPFAPEDEFIRRLAVLLFSSGADFLEVTVHEYETLDGVIPNAQYILRIEELCEAQKYASQKDIRRFVCANRSDTSLRVYPEIRLNDMRDYFTIVRYKECDRIRICGLADVILQPVDTVLNNLKSAFQGATIELAPENDCCAATSIALEWAMTGGTNIVTSIFGIGNIAAFEDVSRALCLLKGRRAKAGLDFLSELESMMKELLSGSDLP